MAGNFKLLWAYILEYENSKNPFVIRRESVLRWKEAAVNIIVESPEVLSFSEFLIEKGVKLYDALHVACAYIGGCDYFLTVDKGLLNKPITEVKIRNPIFCEGTGGLIMRTDSVIMIW